MTRFFGFQTRAGFYVAILATVGGLLAACNAATPAPTARPATPLATVAHATPLATVAPATPLATVAPATPAPATPVPATPTLLVPTSTPSPVSTPAAQPSPAAFEVTVNGLRISGHCSGSRTGDLPIVVLQSGTGGSDMQFSAIERHLAGRTQVCAWSRPGAGESEAPADLPRPVSEVVAETRDVLAALEVEPPYFLIGGSGGAVVTFLFAQANPEDVAGFVAINPNPAYSEWMAMAEELDFPAEFVEGAEQDFRGNNPEGIDFTGNDQMLIDALPPTMPYAVMYDEECGQPDCSEILAPEAGLQERLASVGEGGRFIWAHGAGHEIVETQPELVYQTIDEIWTEAAE